MSFFKAIEVDLKKNINIPYEMIGEIIMYAYPFYTMINRRPLKKVQVFASCNECSKYVPYQDDSNFDTCACPTHNRKKTLYDTLKTYGIYLYDELGAWLLHTAPTNFVIHEKSYFPGDDSDNLFQVLDIESASITICNNSSCQEYFDVKNAVFDWQSEYGTNKNMNEVCQCATVKDLDTRNIKNTCLQDNHMWRDEALEEIDSWKLNYLIAWRKKNDNGKTTYGNATGYVRKKFNDEFRHYHI